MKRTVLTAALFFCLTAASTQNQMVFQLSEGNWQNKDRYISCNESDLCWHIVHFDKENPELSFVERENTIQYRHVEKTNTHETTALVFDSITVSKKIKLMPDESHNLPYATVDIHFVYPAKFGDEEELKKLQLLFYEKFFGEKYDDVVSPQDAADNYLNGYTEWSRERCAEEYLNYSRTLDVWDEEAFYDYQYERIFKNSIVFLNERLLSFTIHLFSYSGGIHGVDTGKNYTIDLKNKKYVELDELFVEENFPPLTTIVKKKLLDAIRIDENEEDEMLKEYFFDFDAIGVTTNFMLTESGIFFTYNPYEIAPYGDGELIEVEVPYDEIKGLLKPDALAKFFPTSN